MFFEDGNGEVSKNEKNPFKIIKFLEKRKEEKAFVCSHVVPSTFRLFLLPALKWKILLIHISSFFVITIRFLSSSNTKDLVFKVLIFLTSFVIKSVAKKYRHYYLNL